MRDAYSRDRFGNIWKHFDSKLFPGQRNKIMLTPEMADKLKPFKFKRDDLREQGSKCCCGKTCDEIIAENSNQPEKVI